MVQNFYIALSFFLYLITKCFAYLYKESCFPNVLQISYNRKYHFYFFIAYTQKYFYFVRVCVCNTEQKWRPEDNLWKSVIAFYHMCPRDQIQAVCFMVANDCTL